jgi:UDP-N-acetylglucosamine--N-acetylmuramyl-(pentapeptide) pyrophosphoryl-undecaprenol N-acetylglucosamine transferase
VNWPAGRTWAVIAGGGTGGHLYPGLAVAEVLAARGHDRATLRFVGARRGLEGRIGALGGVPVTLLPGRGFGRRVSVRGLLRNFQAGAELSVGVAIAAARFYRWRPAVVVSTGGYASVPCVLAAAAWRVPVVVVSLDAVPGAADRLAARLACACAVAWTGSPLPKAVVTGVPVRPEMSKVDRSPSGRRLARERLGLPAAAKVVLVSGGSLGARKVNLATLDLVSRWAQRADLAVRHVVGTRDWEEVTARAPRTAGLAYQPVRYEEDMATAYSAADVAVQRAGASTVAELVLAGVPAVLVPLPGAPGNHQAANADALCRAGGAVVVPDAELDGERLAGELEALLQDGERLARMGEAGRELARPQAAEEIAGLVESCARKARYQGKEGALAS